MSQDSLLPHNASIEQIILGCLLQNNSLFDKISTILDNECFFIPLHQKIYEAIEKKIINGHSADIITLVNMIDETSYLKELLIPFPQENIVEYAEILYDLSCRRKMITMAKNLLINAYDEKKPIEDQVECVEQVIFHINKRQIKTPTIQFFTGAQKVFVQAKKFIDSDREMMGIDTGFEYLNKTTGGLQPGELIILAGRPGTGKTAFALNLAVKVASNTKQGCPVLFLSLEMPYEQLCARIISTLSGISVSTLLFGRVNHALLGQCAATISKFKDLPLFINDASTLNIGALKSLLRQTKRQNNVGMIIVDYLQLIESSKFSENREQEIGKISRSLKMIAKDFGIPIIALSQMSRDVEKRENGPKLSDLRGSGTIEQDADKVMFLHRPDSKNSDMVQLILAKNRNGTLGAINFKYEGNLMKFTELDISEY